MLRSVIVVVLAVLGCRSHSHETGGSVTGSSLLLTWKPHMLPIGMAVGVLDGVELAVMGDATKGSISSGFRPVRLAVWFGPGNDLAAWRDGIGSNPGAAFGAESDATVCGRPARKLEGATPDRAPAQVVYNDGRYGVEQNPGETFVAVAFRYKDVPVVAFYVVATAERARFAGDEAHFFASIDCP